MSDRSVLLAADLAAALANTAPWIWRDRRDHLPDLASLEHLVVQHGLPADGLEHRDVSRARELRPELRAPFEAETDLGCLEAIDHLLARLAPVPRITSRSARPAIRLRCPTGFTIDDVLAQTAHALAQVVISDGRRRLSHCAADTCSGVFLDTTRNRSRRFCMPALCGNRTNVAAHRRRSAQR